MLSADSEDDAVHQSGEACLFYVGATRARDHLILSYSERYGKQKYSRSPYIDALVAGLPEERISRVLWKDSISTEPLEREANDVLPSSQPSSGFIDAMKPQTLTVSAIESYATCPRRYAYSYIYGFEADKGAYQLFWQATQKTLEALQAMLVDAKGEEEKADGSENRARATRTRFPTRAEAQELYTQHWRTMGGEEFPFAGIYEEHGREVIDLVWNKLAGSRDTKWELRQGFDVEVAGKTVRVDVDRVETSTQAGRGQSARFVRTQFGKRKDKPAATTREMLYARAYRQHHPGQHIELHGHNMSTGETFEIKLTEKREQKLYDELEQLILALERNEFPAKPDPFICPACPFVLICPA
jgi:CRISPR/Cas system-associated exonuclease Cas4 (RecB family)